MKTKIKNVSNISNTKFISLYDVEFENKVGSKRHWMVSSRKSEEELKKIYLENKEDKPDAVVLITIHKETNKLVLLRQYRVPVNGFIYELPAGIIDNNEDIKEASKRELKEETGLDLVEIKKVHKKYYISPGMTDESVILVCGICSGEISDKYLEDDEEIEAILISQDEVKNIIESDEKIDMKVYLVLKMFEKLGEKAFF